MNLHDIQNWLANPAKDYATGHGIYNAFKNNNKFDNFFNGVQNPSRESMHFKLLVQRVSEIHRKLLQNPNIAKPEPISVKPINVDELKKKSSQRISPIDPKRPRITDNPLIDASQLPVALQRMWLENKVHTKDISLLHQELKAVPEGKKFDAKRQEIASKLTQKDDLRAANWDKIDSWWRENKLKTEEQKQEFDAKKEEMKVSLQEAKALFNKIDSLKINISREEKRMAKDKVLKEKLTPKVEQWKKELAELEAKL